MLTRIFCHPKPFKDMPKTAHAGGYTCEVKKESHKVFREEDEAPAAFSSVCGVWVYID